MTTLVRRDDGELSRGITAWCAHRWPAGAPEVVGLARPSAGWSNETLLVTTNGAGEVPPRFVVRLPPLVPTWPAYDLRAQAVVLEAIADDLRVPRVVAFEPDTHWLGAPFLVMSHEPGRAGAEVPALDDDLLAAPVAEQRRMHEAFLDVLAAMHRVDWRARGLTEVLRGGEQSTAREVAWWQEYVDWAAEGEPTPSLRAAIEWCAANAPRTDPPASLCWGDARIGNALFAPDRTITSVLDWELATIGSAESDLAWYLVLEAVTTKFVRRSVPGFLDRDAVIARYEVALGRPVQDLEWHEVFALARSVAVNDLQARLAARTGVAYPGVAGEENPVLQILTRKIEAFPASSHP